MTPRIPPCSACKCLKRKCSDDCVFAPYFPPESPDQLKKFADVHSVFGSNNVGKILKDLPPSQRKNAANSLVCEARQRLKDPVYGCVGLIAILQHKLKQVQTNIITAKKDLATYINSQPQGFIPQQQVHPGNPSSSAAVLPYNMSPMIPPGASTQGGQLEIGEPQIQSQHHGQQHIFEAALDQAIREQHELLRTYELLQQPKPVSFNGGFDSAAAGGSNLLFEAQQLVVAAREQHEILQTYEQQQQRLASFNSGFDPAAAGNSITASGFYETNIAGGGMLPSLAPGTFGNPYQFQPHQGEHHGHPFQTQPQQLHQQDQQTQQAQSESD